MRYCGAVTTLFAKTGVGFGTTPAAPSTDPSSRKASLADSVEYGILVNYTKGTSGETAINVGYDVSSDGGTTWLPRVDDNGSRVIVGQFAATFTGALPITSFSDFIFGTHMRLVAWTSGASVASTSLTLSIVPIKE